MSSAPEERRTAIALLTRVRPDLVEIRYDAGTTLAGADLAEAQEARRALMGDRPYATLTIVPEDVDFQLGSMNMDHAAVDRTQGLLIATAVVCRANMIEMLVKLYFSYFPQLHRVHVTDNEAEARAWVEAQLEENAKTGT
jgi:hypothetical protein